MFPPPDFESGASTNSATGARPPDHSRIGPRVNFCCRTNAMGIDTPNSRRYGVIIEVLRMSQLSMDRIHSDPAGSAAIVVAAIGAATILGAYFFQFVLK